VVRHHKMQNLQKNKKNKVYEFVPELLQKRNE